jgi:hypothetical protein
VDDVRHPGPRVPFAGELMPARRRDGVEARSTIGRRGAPFLGPQATLLQLPQSRIERAPVEPRRATGPRLEGRGNGVAVQPPERIQRLMDHQVERARQTSAWDRATVLDTPMEYHRAHWNVK